MILAFDTYYVDSKGKTVCLAFRHWTDTEPSHVFTETLEGIQDYQPGAFYKRELPCILSLLQTVGLSDVEAIVVDGFVYLDDQKKPGLGHYLYENIEHQVPVIGVAKTNFATIQSLKRLVYRGQSANPLYITAIGMDTDLAAQHIQSMAGDYRVPTLLKMLDTLTRQVVDIIP